MSGIDNSKIKIYSPEKQGYGEFDNAKITEIKPIDFPGGTSEAKRIGPLFYWSWASAKGDGIISMHPHQAFEIISYVLEGEIGHSDSLRNKTRVGAGGAQLIQAGSGIYHQEEMYGQVTEFFQIWFEPNLNETIHNDPKYIQLTHNQFPEIIKNGVTLKNIIGEKSPLKIVADVKMNDVTINEGSEYQINLPSNNVLAAVNVSGKGNIKVGNEVKNIFMKDYFVIKGDGVNEIFIVPEKEEFLRIISIEVPEKVEYKLYPN